ncbi:MAG: hypothetical protein A2285_09080 [Elusimicrobia bacterium RIFOXYA12_FULL_57_11]|nr:MAG: hypothetical protein A2285_09080 [Elusimicrobia bacterium RIFOXYA12_FULL_57_11]
MKKVIAILALVALTGNIASAELLKNFKYDGKIEINGFSTNNLSDTHSDLKDKTSDVNARVQINAGFDLNEDVNAVISAVRCQDQYGDSANGESAVNTAMDSFDFEQSYLNLKGVLGFDHKIGRQYYGNEGDLIVYYGPRSVHTVYATANNLSVTGLEGYTGWYKTGKLDMHAVMAKFNNGVGNQPDLDTDLVGVSAKYDLMDEVKIGAYIYEAKDYKAGTSDFTKDVVGVKAMGKFMGFDYYAELAKNYGYKGADVNYTGSAILANVKYDLDLMGKWSFMGEMARGSGDKASATKDERFTSVNTDYRPGIIWGAQLNNTGLGNATTWNLGANWTPAKVEKLTLTGKLYNFAVTEDTGLTYDRYGNELDLCANWQHSENVGLKAYYAMFMPEKDYTDAIGAFKSDDNITTLGAALTVKF